MINIYHDSIKIHHLLWIYFLVYLSYTILMFFLSNVCLINLHSLNFLLSIISINSIILFLFRQKLSICNNEYNSISFPNFFIFRIVRYNKHQPIYQLLSFYYYWPCLLGKHNIANEKSKESSIHKKTLHYNILHIL